MHLTLIVRRCVYVSVAINGNQGAIPIYAYVEVDGKIDCGMALNCLEFLFISLPLAFRKMLIYVCIYCIVCSLLSSKRCVVEC